MCIYIDTPEIETFEFETIIHKVGKDIIRKTPMYTMKKGVLKYNPRVDGTLCPLLWLDGRGALGVGKKEYILGPDERLGGRWFLTSLLKIP